MATLRGGSRFFAALTLAVVAGFVGGCEEKITQENYLAIKPGMALHEVEQILGSKGEADSASGVSISGAGIASGGSTSSRQSNYSWKKGRKEISVVIEGGKVVTSSKAGF